MVVLEQEAMQKLRTMIEMVAMVVSAAAVLRWATARARAPAEQLKFEEQDAAVLELGLYRDGVVLGRATEENEPGCRDGEGANRWERKE